MSDAKRGPGWGMIIAAAIVVGVVFALWPRTPQEPEQQSASRPAAETPAVSPSGDSPRIEPEGRPPEADRAPDAGVAQAEKPKGPPPPITPESPLTGLETRELSTSEISELGLPEKLAGGVVVTRVSPTSPAAEARLQPDDIITKAHKTDVTRLEDLQHAIGDREQTMLRVYRKGRPFDVVLHKPYKP